MELQQALVAGGLGGVLPMMDDMYHASRSTMGMPIQRILVTRSIYLTRYRVRVLPVYRTLQRRAFVADGSEDA